MLALGNESTEIIAEVLQCTQCAGKLSVAANALICARCGDRVPGEEGIIDSTEYLATLDDAAFGAATDVTPKLVSPSDPAAQWTGAMRGPAFFAYPPP
jgi:hypothetical protein